MPDKYDNFLFGDDEWEKKSKDDDLDDFALSSPYVPEEIKEPLDEILDNVEEFNQKAEPFSRLLSEANAASHKVENDLASMFFITNDPKDQGSLQAERDYHALLSDWFQRIIVPMKELATIHLNTVKQFNRDIDKNYYSIEKMDREVKQEKSSAVEGIYLQRLVLADAAKDLEIFDEALERIEKRMKQYIDAGGSNNISASEVAMIHSKRESMTTGKDLSFDYSFFKLNVIDKTAITFGLYQKETSNQYISKLSKVFE